MDTSSITMAKARARSSSCRRMSAADLLALGDELTGVELSHDRLERLVGNGRQHALVVVGAEARVDGGQCAHVGLEQHSQADVDRLQVLGAGGAAESFGSSANIEHSRPLQPRHAQDEFPQRTRPDLTPLRRENITAR